MGLTDTDEKARAVQLAVLRRLGPAERVRLAAEMSEDARRIAFEAEARRHPELSAEQARQVVLDRMWGPELAAAVHRARTTPAMSTELGGLLDRVGKPSTPRTFRSWWLARSRARRTGCPGRDLDVVIDPASRASLDALLSLVPGELYYVDADAARDALRRRGMFNVIDLASGWKVDLIVKKDRAFSRSEFERRIPMTVLGIPVFVASPRTHRGEARVEPGAGRDGPWPRPPSSDAHMADFAVFFERRDGGLFVTRTTAPSARAAWAAFRRTARTAGMKWNRSRAKRTKPVVDFTASELVPIEGTRSVFSTCIEVDRAFTHVNVVSTSPEGPRLTGNLSPRGTRRWSRRTRPTSRRSPAPARGTHARWAARW